MANPQPLIAHGGDDLIWDAGLSASSEDADYPVENAQGVDPALVFKAAGNTTTVTITVPSSLAVFLALINTNAESGTLNGHVITFPGLDEEGQRLNPRLDLTGLIVSPTTTYTLVLSKASGVVWIGRICLLTAVHALNVKYGWETGRRRHGETTIVTRLGSIIKHKADIRTRWARGVVDLIEDEAMLRQVDAYAAGSHFPFLLIPDEETNDAWFVRRSSSEFSSTIPNYDVREITLTFDELSGGPPNG